MKNYKEWANNDYDQVKPASLNDNTQKTTGTWNGRLDGQNMPIDSVGKGTLIQPTYSQTSVGGGDCRLTQWTGATQSIYHIQHFSGLTYPGGTINDWLADEQILLYSESWNSGWNHINKLSKYTDFLLEYEAIEGSINGWFQVNFRYGCDAVTPSGGGGVSVIGDDWFVNFGLFMNDQLIAESGQLRCRGENATVPFQIPIGSQRTKWDIRWLASVNQNYSFYAGDVSAFIELYNAQIFCMNTHK